MRVQELLESVKLPRRYAKTGVGKSIGGKLYVHRHYEDVLGSNVDAAKKHIGELDYDIVALAKDGSVTFTVSPDWNSSHEPSIGTQILVKPDGTTRVMKAQADPWIYHHKWLFVKDDYTGFDVEESKRRSLDWMSLPNVDKSRIGKKSFWDKNVVPQLSSWQ